MADLYAKPSDFIETGYNPEQQQAGGVNKEVEEYLNSLPLEERDAARQRLMAPPTGEEIAMMVDQDESYVPTIDQFGEIEKWHKTKEVGIFDGLGTAAEMVFNEFGAAFGSATDKPLETAQKLPATVIEAFMQGTRSMYGMAAQSQNPDSPFFRVKDFLNGTGTIEDRYNQYIEALDFNRKSKRLMEGKETLVMDKDLINPEVTQAMSYIADPTLFIPFAKVASAGARAVGMGEKLTLAAGRATAIKNKIIGGAIKWGAGQPLEFLGGAVRNTIDFGLEKAGDVFETATGMEAKEFARTARLSGIGVSAAGVAGHSIPYANAISDAYFTAGAGRGLGEALTAVGETMSKSPFDRGINSWAREALEQANKSGTPLSKQAQGLLKALDAVDPMFAYSYAMAEGAAQGMAIGGTLGYLSGGEEGLYQGMGAGLALGTMGAGAGKVVADVTGGTGVARRAVQAKMVIEGKKVTDPETAVALQALQSAAESRGKDVDFVNGIIAGIDNLAPNTVLHALSLDQFKIEAVKQGYDPDTGRFAETQNLVDLSEFGDNRQMRGRTTAFLRLLGGSFAGDADKLLGLSKDARFQTKLNERIKTQFNTLSEFEKDFVVRELKRQKALIDSGKKKASDFRADYEAVSWGESWTAEIIKKYGTDAEGAKRDIKSILDDETVNGKLTRRGRVLKDRLRAEGFLSRNGDILSERNLHDADMTSGVFDKIKGAVVTREADGKTHLYLNLKRFGDETFPHELFHAIFRDSPMKHQFVDSLAGKLLGVRDEKGNLVKEPEIAPSELKKFFKRYIEKTTYNQDGSFNREAADRMYKLVENGLAEYEATGDLKKISDSTRQLLNKYTEEFGAYYFSNWIMGKNRNYLFYGGELRGIAGIIDSVKENWLDFWQSKISSANPSFDFSNGVNEAFAKGGSVGRISAIDIWMRDMVRANANSLRGAFNPDTMSADNARQFYRSNGIRNIADSNGRPLQVNKQTAESRRLGREAFKILNGLDPTLRTTRTTLDTDGKQVITGKFSDAELDALVRGGIVPRAWADKVRQGYAMVDGTMPNVASFGYLGKTEQIGDYSWPRKTGKDVAFKNRKAIVFDVETKVRADGTFYTLFHTLDKAVIEQRGNDLWRNAEIRKLWNDDRGAMEADFFNYLNNASKPSTDSTKKDSASLLEKGDGLGAKRRDAMHQMAGMALQEGDSYRHKPMAEIPQGIRHSVTTFNVDGMTTLRIDKTERYNVDMNNAHKFIRENWQPEDMKQEKTPNGMAFTHASGFKFLRTDDGKVSVYTVVGNKVGTYNNLKEATQKAKSEYHKVYDNIEKSVRDIIEKQNKDTMSYQGLSADERAEAIESGDVFSVQSVKDFVGNRPLLRQTRDEHIYQRAFEAIKNPEELIAYAESVTRENLKVKAELEKLVKESERRSQILEEQKNAFADTHYAKLEELKKKHNYVTSWEQWKGVLRETGEWRPPSNSVNDYSKFLIEKQAQYEENAKKSWANLAADPEYIALMSNMDRWQESFVKPQVDSIIKFEEQIERFKVENQEALSDPVAVELYGNVMKYETLSRTDKADMFARIVGNSARNRDYSGLLEALFAREYDEQIQTGKPFVAVTTHGTKSVELMVGRVYSEAALGSKHNIPSSNMGTFSAGSQNTSRFYAENAPTQDLSLRGISYRVSEHSAKGKEVVVDLYNKINEVLGRRYDELKLKEKNAEQLFLRYKKEYDDYAKLHTSDPIKYPAKVMSEEHLKSFDDYDSIRKRLLFTQSRNAFIVDERTLFLAEGSTESWASEIAPYSQKVTRYAIENDLIKSYPDKRMQVRSLIRMDNPYVVIDPRSYEEYRISPHMRRAIENGHDGIVFKRFEDGGQADNVYVVFKGFADEQTKIIDTSWDDVGVPRGRDETGRVLKSGKELNLSFQPDDYRGGDDYYKPKKNPFEHRDERGLLVRRIMVGNDELTGDKDARGAKYNPEYVGWEDIGHYPQEGTTAENIWEAKNSGLWYWKDDRGIRTKNPMETDNPSFTHSEWFDRSFKYQDDMPSIYGRYEKPKYDKKGNLIKKGRISITSNYRGEIKSIADANFYKESIASTLGVPVDHIDAYLFGANDKIKSQMGYGLKDQLPIKFQPDEGGRTYSEKEMAGKFIGRYAAENPNLIKGKSVMFTKDQEAGLNGGQTYRLSIRNKNEKSGYINVEVDESGKSASVEYTKVNILKQGKGYGNLLYSEMVERLRSLGVEEFSGMIVDESGRPQKIRKRIIDKENLRVGGRETEVLARREDESGYSQTDIVSYLDKKAWYEPDDKDKAPVNWVKSGLGTEGYNMDVVWMKPSRFLNLAFPFLGDYKDKAGRPNIESLKKKMQSGSGMDRIYLRVDLKKGTKSFKVLGHEGRHRATAAMELFGDDKLIPVEIDYNSEHLKEINRGDYDYKLPEGKKLAGSISRMVKENKPMWNEKGTAKFQPEELELINITRTQDVPWFKNLISDPSSYVRYVDVEELNSLRGLYAVSHGADTLTGVDVMTDKGRRVVEGKGGLGYALNPNNEAGWASIGSAFVKLINDTVKLNLEDKDIGQKTAILPLVFTTYRKNLNSVQGSEAFYNFFEILRRGKIVSDTDLRLAMADAVVKTYKDKKGNIKQSQTDTLKMLVSDTRMNWDEMLSGILLTLDKSSIQNFGTRGRMADDFFGAVWNRLNLSEAKQKKIKSVFPEWTTVSSGRNITVEDIKTNVANITTDTLSRNLKNGDVYAILKFNDFVTTTESNHRSYDTGVVQENGKKPEVFILKKPISINDFYHSSVTSKGERVLSDISDRKVVTNLLGMNARPYGQAKVKPKEIADFRSLSTKFQPAEDFGVQATEGFKWYQRAKHGIHIPLEKEYRYDSALDDVFAKKMTYAQAARNNNLSPNEVINMAKRYVKRNPSLASELPTEAIKNYKFKWYVPSEKQKGMSLDKAKKIDSAMEDIIANEITAQEAAEKYSIPKTDLYYAITISRQRGSDFARLLSGKNIDKRDTYPYEVNKETGLLKISRKNRMKILSMREQGYTLQDIANEIGISQQGVSKILINEKKPNLQPAEWSDFKTEQSPMGRIMKNAKGYSIMLINNKYRVYNPAKAIIGVYGNEEEAKRRVLRDAPKQ